MNDFPAFWAVYPRKVARKAAERAWKKLAPSPELVALIIFDVKNKLGSPQWVKDRGQYVPYPASYLNGARWEDEDEDEAAVTAYSGIDDFVRDNE